MKAYLPVVIVVIAIIVIVVLVLCVRVVRDWIEQHKAVLDCLSIVGVIGLVLSLLVTVSHLDQYSKSKRKSKTLPFIHG